MRKITLIILASLLLLVISTYQSFAAETAVPSQKVNMPTVTPFPTPTPVDYQLPYPGLLPDNFLYRLKTLRDRIIGFLISDPLKKADFNILQADKRYNAGLYLFKKDVTQEELIASTVSKADNYMEEAINQLDLAKKQGLDIKDLTAKILLSNEKHLEVLTEMEKTAAGSLKKSFLAEEGRIAHVKDLINTELLTK